MTFGEHVKTLLAAAAPVTAFVAGRVFPARLPQGVTLPAVRYSVVSDVPTTSAGGATGGLRRARVQVDCFAKRYADAHALADAVAGALRAITTFDVTSTQIGRSELYEDETELHRVTQDFSMWMTET